MMFGLITEFLLFERLLFYQINIFKCRRGVLYFAEFIGADIFDLVQRGWDVIMWNLKNMDLPFKLVIVLCFSLLVYPNQVLFYGYILRYSQGLWLTIYGFLLNLICLNLSQNYLVNCHKDLLE